MATKKKDTKANSTRTKSKFGELLEKKGWSYSQFQEVLENQTGLRMGFDRISRMALGKQKDMLLSTATNVANALNCKIEDINEFQN